MTDLSARYGTKRRPRWFWPAITAVGVSIGVGFAAWIALQSTPVTAEVHGYDVVDAHHVTVSLNISRPDPIAVECTVYAQSADHAIVGEKTVTVPPSKSRDIRFSIDVKTERKAVNGVLRTCRPVK
ncbi:MAG: hypothetical protein JWR83_1271 [Aeromicrobium sp.]|nr:hypothetical protein [Aeromicrobium sp.]